mmetsp:Transcript_25178/g.65708  ORF Transcript_25178/g.65708 Transcript_25178/m.65708 type:complete len:226 (+) Transcript_25178:805-1482(+)
MLRSSRCCPQTPTTDPLCTSFSSRALSGRACSASSTSLSQWPRSGARRSPRRRARRRQAGGAKPIPCSTRHMQRALPRNRPLPRHSRMKPAVRHLRQRTQLPLILPPLPLHRPLPPPPPTPRRWRSFLWQCTQWRPLPPCRTPCRSGLRPRRSWSRHSRHRGHHREGGVLGEPVALASFTVQAIIIQPPRWHPLQAPLRDLSRAPTTGALGWLPSERPALTRVAP